MIGTDTHAENRPTAADGHLFVDQLVSEGLAEPALRKVRDDFGELTVSLTLADDSGFTAWAEKLDSTGAVDSGPWRIGPVSARVAVGRIRGVRAVLAVMVDHADDTRPARAERPSPVKRPLPHRARELMGMGVDLPTADALVHQLGAEPTPPGPDADPPAPDVLVAPSVQGQAESPPAPDAVPTRPAPEADDEAVTTADHDFRDLLGPDGRPRPLVVAATAAGDES